MFEISELKAKKLPELQYIDKKLNVQKYRTQKKLDLVYQILDQQAANPSKVKEVMKDDTSFSKSPSEKEPVDQKETSGDDAGIVPSAKRGNERSLTSELKDQNPAGEKRNEVRTSENSSRVLNKPHTSRDGKEQKNFKKEQDNSSRDNNSKESGTSSRDPGNNRDQKESGNSRDSRDGGNSSRDNGNSSRDSRENTGSKDSRDNGNSSREPRDGSPRESRDGNSSRDSRDNSKNPRDNRKDQRTNKPDTGNTNKNNGNRDNRNRYREPDYEFDAIIESEEVLDIMQDKYGFLRSSDYNYLSSPDDIYVSQSQIRLFGLKTGDTVLGQLRPPKGGEKYFPLIKLVKINGLDPQVVRDRISFEHLTPLFPKEKFNIGDRQSTISTRIMDLFSPIGKGQRGMIVS